MAETSAMNSHDKLVQYGTKRDENKEIKKEVEVPVPLVKPEPPECVVCVKRSQENFNIHNTHTNVSGISLHAFLSKFTNTEFPFPQNFVRYICKTCLDLVNILEEAEIEYLKLKQTFETIISKNPLFYLPQPLRLDTVKNELQDNDTACADLNDDSENEPLVVIKKKRGQKVGKRKKALSKRKSESKPNNEESGSWECSECGVCGEGGAVAEASHQLTAHTILRDIKKEDTNDGEFSNGFETVLKVEPLDDDIDNDSDSDFLPDEELSNEETKRKRKVLIGRRPRTKGIGQKKRDKVLHECDQCNAKYTSLVRLEQHKQKHDGSKPPYICEVCGAHYKHKRACDIHIAMHKGISDWKCEECNKLFPSKGALQRHNNIHTGKLNYQCDLCGKSFIHTSSFKMHKLSHSGVKPHSCDVCGLALMTRSHLKRHKRVHSGEKRHECGVCGRRFSERYNLLAHSKSHESGAGAAVSAAAAEQARRRLFRCPFCAERFERRFLLERHAGAAHGRALERPPPTPRNTMSKLLKAQAARPPANADGDSKDIRSPDSTATTVTPQKLIAHLSSSPAVPTNASWSSAYAEFNLRSEFH
ncbi:zinc finger protein 814 [Amyelois transitella]|uniref:zinc finger protein 814 n=1 Tax=Amyelois transitella TaxID=680683 RepID=UPI00298FD23D|nr:zinc finger protein 814 [Amyelois transitella]